MQDLRLLLMDMTPVKGGAATSALKRAYFDGWNKDALIHIQSANTKAHPSVSLLGGRPQPIASAAASLEVLLERFRPQVILYRPVADNPHLHNYAMTLLRRSTVPLAIWLMDDWPMRLKEKDPQQYEKFDRDLHWLLERSALNLAISKPMAEAFAVRYGVDFEVFHNGVSADLWPRSRRSQNKHVIVRYAGSLAPDTARGAVFAVASAVSTLAEKGTPVRMEIRTQPHWLRLYETDYHSLSGVEIRSASMSDSAYRRWLSAADIIPLCYNFDADTKRYLRYSFANKTPEALASGAAVLAFGPRGIATIDYLVDTGGIAELVTTPDRETLTTTIQRLVENTDYRVSLSLAARQHVFKEMNLQNARKRFYNAFRKIACDTRLIDNGKPPLGARYVVKAIAPKKTLYRKTADHLATRHPTLARLVIQAKNCFFRN